MAFLAGSKAKIQHKDGLRVLDEAEREKGQGESGKAQVEQEEGWLDVFMKGLDDLMEVLDEFVEGLNENGLVGGGLVLGRGIFPTGVVVGVGISVIYNISWPGLLHYPFS